MNNEINTKLTKEHLTYFDGKHLLPDNAVRIGASSFSRFIMQPWEWYRQQILGIDKFQGSTSTIIGTLVHAIAALKAEGHEPDLEEMEKYIFANRAIEGVDATIVRNSWKPMAVELVNKYVLPNKNSYSSVEEFITQDLGNDIYIGGSIDAIQGEQWINPEDKSKGSSSGMIIDYKTYNSNTKPKVIPPNYKQQLLVYAWVLKQHNRCMDRIRLVYISRERDTRSISEKTGKPIGKLAFPEVTVLTEEIQQVDLDFIESQINLCKETLLTDREYPCMRRVIWHDSRYNDKGELCEI